VTKYNLPLHRLVQPFGAGQDMPVDTNATAAGRAANRRVEIRLLKNKGIAGE
jgi:flagellar motor protein MotB